MSDPEPTTQALIVRPTVLPTRTQFEVMREVALRLASARGFLPNHFLIGDGKERFAKVFAAIEYGRAVGIEPMIALQNITMIDGKAGASAMLIGAQLRRAGYKPRTTWFDVEGNPVPKESPKVHGCKVVLTKNGEDTGDGVFSLTDAQRAGLIKEKSGWERYPKDMLFARALTQAAREGAQDAVLGMAYTAEELGADVDDQGWATSVPANGSAQVIEAADITVVEEPVEVPPVPASAGADEQAVGASVSVEGAPSTPAPPEPQPDAAQTPPPPPATSMQPLGGAAVTRRMGRSIGPAPSARRTNVVTAEAQAPTAPATAPEEPAQPVAAAEPAASQPAPAGLTDEPVPAAAPPVVDEGERLYNARQREELRQAAAMLTRVNRIYSNKLVHAPKNEAPEEITPAEPNPASDEALRLYIERDFPGRTLETLGTAELQNRLEGVEASLAKKRATMKERGVTEE